MQIALLRRPAVPNSPPVTTTPTQATGTYVCETECQCCSAMLHAEINITSLIVKFVEGTFDRGNFFSERNREWKMF